MAAKKFFQIISPDVRFEIVGYRRKFLTFSGILFITSLILLIPSVRGLNMGIDFSGGTEVQVEFSKNVPAEKLKQGRILAELKKAFPKTKYQVQRLGSEGRTYLFKFGTVSSVSKKAIQAIKKDLKVAFADPKRKGKSLLIGFHFRSEGGDKIDIRFAKKLVAKKAKKGKKPTTQKAESSEKKKKKDNVGGEFDKIRKVFAKHGLKKIHIEGPVSQVGGFEYTVTFTGLSAKIEENLAKIYGAKNFTIARVESVGPRVGKKLRNDGIVALLLANLFILIYIAIRFDFRYAPGAVVALIHDVVITTGVFSALWLPFDLSIVAALLTIVGYSLNDTIVVYDRIRENWQKARFNFGRVMNRSINETLSRTLLTSITTFIAVVPIYVIGGSNIRWFAFAMMFGILIGTYSSIAIASPIVYYLDEYFSRKEKEAEKNAQEKRERRRRRRVGAKA